jgi:ATP-dependent exoDNAse (exonuclease V) beta subunit
MSVEVRQLARNPEHSYLVQAPAGSGKTELLTQRILALLAIVDEPEEILALTFTRKAAAEMRNRVIESLSGSRPHEPDSHKMETWLLAQEVLRRSEQQGWNLLQHPARLRIMTLDSLTYSLARQLPLLSGLGDMPSPSEHAQAIYRDAAEAALNEAMKDYPEDAEQVLLHQDHQAVAVIQLLADMLAKREQWLDDIADFAHDMDGLHHMLEANLAAIMMQKLEACEMLMPMQLKKELPALMIFAGENRGDESLRNLSAWPEYSLDQMVAWRQIADFLLTAQGPAFRKPGGVTVRQGFPADKEHAAQKEQFKALLEMLAEEVELAESLHMLRGLPDNAVMDDEQWKVLKALFSLLALANQQLQLHFSNLGEADFTEIALRAMDALGGVDEAPGDLLMKLDYRIRHILVDEFQDTSLLQMRLLQCLTLGWQEGSGEFRSLFMVGDPMQSIYRFRKAEVGLFLNAANNEAGLPHVEALQLERNFRSAPAIVEWVNRAFQSIFPKVQDVVSGAVVHAPAQAALRHEGGVYLHTQLGKNVEAEAESIVQMVQYELKQLTPAGEVPRIGILARSRKHLHAIMPALGRAGIAFRAIKILPLNGRPEVLLLRALLRSLLHPADRESWAAILRAPCCGLNTIDLHALMAGDNRPVWQLIADNEVTQRLSADAQARLAFLQRALAPCLENSGKVPVRDLLETAWLRLSMPAIVDEGSSLNINAALELIESLEEGGRVNFALLDERLEQLYAAPDASAQAGQVELLTMHGAKGLQWDVVILPGLGHSGGKTDSPLLAFTEVPVPGGATPLIAAKAETRNKDALYSLVCNVEKNKYNNELQRLLYVACTRAKTTLHMLGHVSESKEEASRGSLLSLLLAGSEDCFGAQITSSDPMEQHENDERHALQRIRHIPEIAGPIDEGGSDQETEYVWAGAEAAPVGNAVHAALQHVAETGIENWDTENTDRVLAQMSRMLMADGLSGDMLETATSRCADGLQRVLNSQKGQWMLSGEHQDAHSEWALSSEYENRVSHHVIDRSFIDKQGARWIIDYKTASHEGGDLDRFLADEEIRHAPQLQRYATILKTLEPNREIRTALYFPILDAWKEVAEINS